MTEVWPVTAVKTDQHVITNWSYCIN